MPGFLDAYEGVKRIELGNGYWIDVKLCLSSAEYRRVQAHLGAGRQTLSVSGSGDTTTQIDPASAQDEMLFQSIADWNLDDDGKPWPLSPASERKASIARLPASVHMQVYQVCDELNGPRQGKEAAQFPDEPVGGGPDGDSGPGEPPGDLEGEGPVAVVRPHQRGRRFAPAQGDHREAPGHQPDSA